MAKLDREQAGAAAQLPARDLLRGHGESLRVRVGGMPGVPAAPGPGPGRARHLRGVRPRLGADARPPEPAPLGARRSGRTDRPALCGAPGPARSLVGMCLLSSLQLLLNLTGESRENELAGTWQQGEKGPKGARARGVGAGGTRARRAKAAEGSGCPAGAPRKVSGSGLARSGSLGPRNPGTPGPRGRGQGRRAR